MKNPFVFVLSLALLPLLSCAQETPPPNIILINVDDVGYGDFGAYGQELINTPRIDAMAAAGLRFTDFYAAAPVCGPSRAALLTGRHAGRLGSCGNSQADLTNNFPLWPQRLRDAGYETALFGKQHRAGLQGENAVSDLPTDRGFNHSLGWLNAVDAHQFFLDGATVTPGWARRNYLFRTTANGNTVRHDIAPDRYVHDEFMDAAVSFIQANQGTNFMLYLPLTIAHAELALPGTAYPAGTEEDSLLLGQYLDEAGTSVFPEFDYQGDPIYGRPNPFKTRATLAAMISRLDRDIGLLIDLLEDLGLAENTLILLTSDNGPHDEGGVDEEQINGSLDSPFGSSGGLRGMKRSLYEGGVRVPMIAYWPGTIAPGTDTSLLYHPDIGPTLIELTNAAPLPDADGRSFLGLLRGESAVVHEDLYWQFGTQQSIRRGRFKAYRGNNTSAADRVELYDLSADPGETDDLAEEPGYADLLRELKAALNERNAGSACTFIPLALDPTTGPEPVPAKEKMNYPGGGIDGKGAAANGWSGPWELLTGFNHGLRGGGIRAGAAESEATLTSGNRLSLRYEVNGGDARLVRPLETRYPDDGSTYWLGFWYDCAYSAPGNVFQIMLVGTESFSESGPGGQLLRLGKDFSGEFFGFNNGPYAPARSDSSYFVAAAIVTSGNADPEEIYLFLDPPVNAAPDLASAVATKSIDLNGGFDGLGVKVEGAAGIRGDVDELRVGLRFADLIPNDLEVITADREPVVTAGARIYPNPAYGRVYLQKEPLEGEQAELRDLTGQTIRRWPAEFSSWLDLGGVAPGVYFLRVGLAGGIRTFNRKLVIR